MAVSNNMKGAFLMMASMTAFTVNDALMKSLAGEVPLMQAIFLRGLATSVMMLGLALARGELRWPEPGNDARMVNLRTAMEVVAVFLFLTALFNMPIANATAILQVIPLTVTLAAALLLGEAIGWRRALAIGVGLFGVLLIVRPGTEGFSLYSLSVLGAVLAVTVRDIAVRRMTGGLPALTVASFAAIGVTVAAGAIAAFQPWQPVSVAQAGVILAAALLLMMAYILSVAVMRVGEIAVVAPFRYTAIVVALILGIAAFGERPDGVTLAGVALVVATGVYTLLRERAVARRAAAGAARKPVVDTPPDSL